MADLNTPRICRSGRHLFTGKQCMECKAEKTAAWRAANAEHRAEWQRCYNKENIERRREWHREWAAANPEKVRAKNRRSHEKWASKPGNRETARRRAKQHYLDNRGTPKFKEQRRQQEQRRRARKGAVAAGLTAPQWEAILAWHSSSEGTRCAYCFDVCKPTLDHVVPIAAGGDHSANNVVPACGPCNFSKQARELSKWVW